MWLTEDVGSTSGRHTSICACRLAPVLCSYSLLCVAITRACWASPSWRAGGVGCQRGALWSGLRKPAAERNTGTGGSALCGARWAGGVPGLSREMSRGSNCGESRISSLFPLELFYSIPLQKGTAGWGHRGPLCSRNGLGMNTPRRNWLE